jgi:hypothetical protein
MNNPQRAFGSEPLLPRWLADPASRRLQKDFEILLFAYGCNIRINGGKVARSGAQSRIGTIVLANAVQSLGE